MTACVGARALLKVAETQLLTTLSQIRANDMSNPLTYLGILHTVIGLVAIVTGAVSLYRHGVINPKAQEGEVYLLATLVTSVTALGIFQRGGFGPAHVLALLTLAALAIGWLATATALFGRLGVYVQTVSFSTTFLFNVIPGVTESLTRLPPSAPIVSSIDAPVLLPILMLLLAIFVVGLAFQLRHIRRANRT